MHERHVNSEPLLAMHANVIHEKKTLHKTVWHKNGEYAIFHNISSAKIQHIVPWSSQIVCSESISCTKLYVCHTECTPRRSWLQSTNLPVRIHCLILESMTMIYLGPSSSWILHRHFLTNCIWLTVSISPLLGSPHSMSIFQSPCHYGPLHGKMRALTGQSSSHTGMLSVDAIP